MAISECEKTVPHKRFHAHIHVHLYLPGPENGRRAGGMGL